MAAILSAILDFTAMDMFYKLTKGSIEILDPENLCLDTKINLLGELVTEIQALTAILAAIFNLCKYLKMLKRYRVASSRFEISGYELYKNVIKCFAHLNARFNGFLPDYFCICRVMHMIWKRRNKETFILRI